MGGVLLALICLWREGEGCSLAGISFWRGGVLSCCDIFMERRGGGGCSLAVISLWRVGEIALLL